VQGNTRGRHIVDFLIVGGGIAGISAAARLSKLGSVVLLETEAGLGYHASGRSAAMFEETYGSASTVALNRASRDYLRHANGGVLSPRGFMLIGTKDTRTAFARDMAAMALSPMSLAKAQLIVPILDGATVSEIGYHSEAWDIDTDLLMQNFAREARGNGAKILMRKSVDSIRPLRSGWQVTCTGGDEFSAKILINAAGAWVDEVARMAGLPPLGFTPYRRSIARIPAPDDLDVTNWPLIFGPGETWYAKPDAGHLLVSPADEDPTKPHDAWPEDLTLAEGIARFESVTTSMVTRIKSSWAGLRTFSPDRSLVIGADADTPAFFWIAGQGGYGFQSSVAASRLLADLVAGTASELDQSVRQALSPARFR